MKTEIELNRIYERNELIWGKEIQQYLFTRHIIVAGIGGVGSYAAEALARSGVGNITLIDFDTVSSSNINRQLPALLSNIGEQKTELMKKRIELINPHIKVNIISEFYTKKLNKELFGSSNHMPDLVIDAIDTLKSKIDLIESCYSNNIEIISSFGAGNRIKPEELYIADIIDIKSGNCPFITNIKHKLKQRGIIKGITAVASHEKPIKCEKIISEIELISDNGEKSMIKKFSPGSTPFVPPVAGYIMASWAVRRLLETK